MDAMTADFEPQTFDVIYSRDTILHIEKKEELFRLCLVGFDTSNPLTLTIDRADLSQPDNQADLFD